MLPAVWEVLKLVGREDGRLLKAVEPLVCPSFLGNSYVELKGGPE